MESMEEKDLNQARLFKNMLRDMYVVKFLPRCDLLNFHLLDVEGAPHVYTYANALCFYSKVHFHSDEFDLPSFHQLHDLNRSVHLAEYETII